jgi:hypothetical protein
MRQLRTLLLTVWASCIVRLRIVQDLECVVMSRRWAGRKEEAL